MGQVSGFLEKSRSRAKRIFLREGEAPAEPGSRYTHRLCCLAGASRYRWVEDKSRDVISRCFQIPVEVCWDTAIASTGQ